VSSADCSYEWEAVSWEGSFSSEFRKANDRAAARHQRLCKEIGWKGAEPTTDRSGEKGDRARKRSPLVTGRLKLKTRRIEKRPEEKKLVRGGGERGGAVSCRAREAKANWGSGLHSQARNVKSLREKKTKEKKKARTQ